MKILALLLLVSVLHARTATASVYAEFASSSSVLVVGHLKALARTDDPLSTIAGNRVVISNGCGYDTVVVEVRTVLAGRYDASELAAHLELDEFCTSILQEEAKDYLLALRWNGAVWEVDAQRSSRLLPDASGELWLVEPTLIGQIASAGGPEARSVSFPAAVLEDLALGRERRRGVLPDPRETRLEQLAQLWRHKPVEGDWPDNPLYFSKGIRLSDLVHWLTANNSSKPKPLRGSA